LGRGRRKAGKACGRDGVRWAALACIPHAAVVVLARYI
jgi:hypothetical protein